MEKRYLGDGVYAAFDGYQIILTLDEQENESCICLDSDVMHELKEFETDCITEANNES